MKKKQSLMSFLCFLLSLTMPLPTLAGGGYSGEIRQNGSAYNFGEAMEESGDGWSYSEFVNGKFHPTLTLNNFKAESLLLPLSEDDVTLALADGSVSELDSLVLFLSAYDEITATLTVEGTGTLIIRSLQGMQEYGPYTGNLLEFISISEGATVTILSESDNATAQPDDGFNSSEVSATELPDDYYDDEWWNLPFADVPDDAYYWDAVRWAIDDGITKGTSDTTFSPDAACTRGQVATFLWRAYDCPEPATTTNPFTDVSESSPFYKAILWAAERGITTGTSETTFSPGNTCTNAHVITFLWRFMYQPDASRSSALADSLPQGYYTPAVAWADSEGVLSETDKAFDPSAPCPRADIVHYLYRAYVDIDAPAVEATH